MVRKGSRDRELCVEDGDGNMLIWPQVAPLPEMRDAAARLASGRGESVYLLEVGEDSSDGARVVVDREEVRPGRRGTLSSADIEADVARISGAGLRGQRMWSRAFVRARAR